MLVHGTERTKGTALGSVKVTVYDVAAPFAVMVTGVTATTLVLSMLAVPLPKFCCLESGIRHTGASKHQALAEFVTTAPQLHAVLAAT